MIRVGDAGSYISGLGMIRVGDAVSYISGLGMIKIGDGDCAPVPYISGLRMTRLGDGDSVGSGLGVVSSISPSSVLVLALLGGAGSDAGGGASVALTGFMRVSVPMLMLAFAVSIVVSSGLGLFRRFAMVGRRQFRIAGSMGVDCAILVDGY